ncbi:MAG TPA: NADP-dependent glyceraldehyde-3-phosphate dehydrogenase [Spirochaetota bacterium]|jgi:glyceraldehyde-3-phosphate dehydrogenase (NADP+)|nr:MAG: NADP-dependent glyceraldehyde-3-phosphate dehydrogenase [Spirochaetes bacterium ADurb.Bin133]HNZ25928.1 NADP-dependent glyceraldehyde-3-phosphate dehydrogenase [Spirochaetota bacterium]HPY89024.1 NADP-dependent glyceraldehyde-3-phosphate dehydrogenase [Spirochaetota bacterium]
MNLKQIFPERKDIAANYAVKRVDQKEYLVNGEIRIWNGQTHEIVSPICVRDGDKLERQVIGSTPLVGEKEALEALDAAVKAWDLGRGEWPAKSVEDRIACVQKFVVGMQTKRDEIVNLLMWEIGKSYKDSCKEFDRTIQYIVETIDALKELDRVSSRFQIVDGIVAQIRRSPYGTVLCMGPFNYPLNETFTTLIPALIMGNTVIFKPAKYGVLLNRPLLELFRDCFPKGVVNSLYGDGKVIIGPLMKSGKIDVLAFIGSAKTANIIEKQHPYPNRLRTILGLNAKNPAIILEDADLSVAVKEAVTGSLSYNGQRCTALKILFVHRKIVDRFLEEFSKAVDALKLGMPWDEDVSITPLPEEGKTEWLKSMVDDALAKGAKIVNKGGEICETLYKPAVIYPVTPDMVLYNEEQFGPIVPVVQFDRDEEIIEYAAHSTYGQQASVFGKDPIRVSRLVDALVNQVCRVNINCQCQRGPDVFPFTGRKDSAEGTLSVSDALRAFSIRTIAAAKATDQNKELIRNILKNRNSSFINTDFIL